MKKLIIIFFGILLLSFCINAQTVNWTTNLPTPYAPGGVNVGTNTYSASGNNGNIKVISDEYSCNFDMTCEEYDLFQGYGSGVSWERHYTYELILYDINGNVIPLTSFNKTFSDHISCNQTVNDESVDYALYTWTTAPGSPQAASAVEIVHTIDMTLGHTDNVHCAYGGSDNQSGDTYPLYIPPAGGVLLGPLNNPFATGTNDNDDYTNKSVLGNITGSVTTTSHIINFQNTVRNTDVVTDNFTITAPSVPAGFTVEAAPDCASFSNITSGGNILISGVPASSNLTFCVRITAPAGISTYTPFSSLLRATSVNNPAKSNDTIDRIYTGFVITNKSGTVSNTTGVGGATDPVPGAIIQYFINYQNIANTPYGTGNYDLIGSNLTITEDGNAAPNNWATYTTHEPGSASDSNGGSITGDSAGSNLLTDTVPSLAPGASGTFAFKRKIK